MALSHDFDPTKGYVALPSDIMDIEMSPGAFRLLVELCRMANLSGECWPSLAQLSTRIGRSKAALSGYINELRQLELLDTMNQKMANGYNYRLKYCVTFWKKWRAQLSSSRKTTTVQKYECSVQPSERRVNSKNHIHKTHTPKPAIDQTNSDSASAQLVSIFSKWSNLARSAPFPSFNSKVPETLVEETQRLAALSDPAALSECDIMKRLRALWGKLSVPCTGFEIECQASQLAGKKISQNGMDNVERHIQSVWKPFWRKPPSQHQFAELLVSSGKDVTDENLIKVLKQYLRRWEISQKKLQPTSASHSLTFKHAA